MSSTRRPWVGGNWKCNGTVASLTQLCSDLKKADFDPKKIDVAICPPAIHMSEAKSKLDDKFIICSQNVSKTGNGAFTGEISVPMLKDSGYHWTLIGHSERRQFYGETDQVVGEKVDFCQKDKDMNIVVCIGELLEERNGGKTVEVLKRQMEAFMGFVTDWNRVVIAYEPVWAIGTGVVATPDQAQEAHKALRGMLESKFGSSVSSTVRIVYGGSVSETNCQTLITKEDIDGFLVGGASLKPAFVDIIKSATSKA